MFELPQRRRGFLRIVAVGGLAPILIAGESYGRASEGVEINLKQVPAHLRQAATKAAPGAQWKTAFKNDEDGEVTYEIEGVDHKKREVTVTVTADGKVEEIETEIPVAEVPDVVMRALRAKFPRLEIVAVTEIQEEHKIVGYDFEATRPKDNQTVGVYVTADGKMVHIEEN
jgi:hypothetical protein